MRLLFRIQVGTLLAGTLFAWYTVVGDLMRFYDVEGTLFRIKDCAIPNPVTTPCFWGAWAFLIALIWSYRILLFSSQKQLINQKRLFLLLIGGTIFAWANNGFELYKFFSSSGEPTIGCSGLVVTNPFVTPCFTGATLFLLALLVGFLARRAIMRPMVPTEHQK